MSIFISIVCGADPRLPLALRKAWEHSDAPSGLRFAVVRTANGPLPGFDCAPVPAHQVCVMDHAGMPGGSGRLDAVAMSFYGGEEWILQVAPDADFQPHWDTVLLQKAAALDCANGRSIISAPRVLRPAAGFEPGHLTLPCEEGVLEGGEAVRGFNLSRACLLAPGRFADQFPADPWLDGPEADQALAARLFTHGWNVYYLPGHPINPPATAADTQDTPAARERSRQRLVQLLDGAGELGVYGLGRERGLQEFAHLSGVDYPSRRVDAIAYSIPAREAAPPPLPRSAGRALDNSWKAWLAQNLQRGCRPDELLGILREHEFSLASIRESMGACFPSDAPLPARAAAQRAPDFRVVAQPPLLTRGEAMLRRVETDKLQLYILDDFLSPHECDTLVEVINQHLQPSTVTIESNDKYFRTSRTCHLSGLEDPLVAEIDDKIARTLGIRREYAEPNQAQRYDIGQEFKAHTDYFEPGTDEFAKFGGDRGNRTWTFMVYLNEGVQGGGTRFFSIDRIFEPRKGQAVIWNNLYPDGSPNPDTLHSGMPVSEGHKVIITMWFRAMGGAGPMFFED